MAEAITVTPTLFLGPPEAACHRAKMIPVDNASDAITVIMCGHSALLPADGWDEAAAVLRKFGADEDWIEFRFRIARGELGDVERAEELLRGHISVQTDYHYRPPELT